jgi:hypothetical protein
MDELRLSGETGSPRNRYKAAVPGNDVSSVRLGNGPTNSTQPHHVTGHEFYESQDPTDYNPYETLGHL